MTVTEQPKARGKIAGIETFSASDRPPNINILIYGESGVGKTVLSGSADAVPAMRKVLLLDMEGGSESLRNTYPNVEIARVMTWKKVQEIYNELYSGKHDYSTVIIDSLTETMKFSMEGVLADPRRKENEKVDEDIASQRDWYKNIEQTRRFVRGFRDLPMSTIFTALVREDRNARTGKITKKPSLSGKVASEVAAFLDVVLYYYVKEVKEGDEYRSMRLLLSTPTEEITAKDRTAMLPQITEAPTMEKLYGFITAANQTREGK